MVWSLGFPMGNSWRRQGDTFHFASWIFIEKATRTKSVLLGHRFGASNDGIIWDGVYIV